MVVPVVSPGQDDWVLIVRATNKLLQRVGPPTLQEGVQSTTLLGQWYATALFWKPQIALLVNEPTLLPVLMPLAPAATWPARIASRVATVLTAHATPTWSSTRNCGTCETAVSRGPPTAASSAS